MNARLVTLRYAGHCGTCGTELRPGQQAWWNRTTRSVTCARCATEVRLTDSVAGRSAQRKYERLHANRDAHIAKRSAPIRWISRVIGEPGSTTAWRKGAIGEEKLGARIASLRDEGMVVIHDLSIPNSRANIDHVVIAPSGIHVIDAKRYSGLIKVRNGNLYVGSSKRTNLVEKLAGQILAIDRATVDVHLPTVITPVLCFVDGEWPLLGRGYELQAVKIVWPKKLYELVRRPGDLTPHQITAAGVALVHNLRPA